MTRFLLVLLSFVLASMPVAHAQTAVGAWSGLGLQVGEGPPETWTIVMTLDADGRGRIDYPSLSCGGTLTREGVRGAVALYRERITYGDCVDQGLVGVYQHAGRLMWFWTAEDTPYPGIAASAVLTRNEAIS